MQRETLQTKNETRIWQQGIGTLFNFKELFRKVQYFEGLITREEDIRTVRPENQNLRTLERFFGILPEEEAKITVTWSQKKPTGSGRLRREIIRQELFPFSVSETTFLWAAGEIKRLSRTNPASVFSLGGISPVLQKAPRRGAAGEIKRLSRTNPASVFYLV